MPGLFWADMKAFELRRLAEEGYTVLQPVASTEQHGPGLPTGVDTLLCVPTPTVRRKSLQVVTLFHDVWGHCWRFDFPCK